MSVFPTIQADMREPKKFQKVVVISMSCLFFIYSFMVLAGYLNFEHIADNIIKNLDPKAAEIIIANALITAHFVFAMVIILAPQVLAVENMVFSKKINDELNFEKSQEDEQIPLNETGENKTERKLYTEISTKTKLYRILLRTVYCAVLLFFCLTIPKFDILVSFCSSLNVMIMTFIIPPISNLIIVDGINLLDFQTYKTKISKVALALTVVIIGICNSFIEKF